MLKKQCFYRLSDIYMQRNSYGRLVRLYLFGGIHTVPLQTES